MFKKLLLSFLTLSVSMSSIGCKSKSHNSDTIFHIVKTNPQLHTNEWKLNNGVLTLEKNVIDIINEINLDFTSLISSTDYIDVILEKQYTFMETLASNLYINKTILQNFSKITSVLFNGKRMNFETNLASFIEDAQLYQKVQSTLTNEQYRVYVKKIAENPQFIRKINLIFAVLIPLITGNEYTSNMKLRFENNHFFMSDKNASYFEHSTNLSFFNMSVKCLYEMNETFENTFKQTEGVVYKINKTYYANPSWIETSNGELLITNFQEYSEISSQSIPNILFRALEKVFYSTDRYFANTIKYVDKDFNVEKFNFTMIGKDTGYVNEKITNPTKFDLLDNSNYFQEKGVGFPVYETEYNPSLQDDQKTILILSREIPFEKYMEYLLQNTPHFEKSDESIYYYNNIARTPMGKVSVKVLPDKTTYSMYDILSKTRFINNHGLQSIVRKGVGNE